ncbi:MAG: ubiquinone biosynthesis protein [Myxococcota bacterium]|jgi:ubiquinone biosynthesis protein
MPTVETPNPAESKPPSPPLTWDRLAGTVDASLRLVGQALGHAQRLAKDVKRDVAVVRNDTVAMAEVARAATRSVHDSVRTAPRVARIGGRLTPLVLSYRVHMARIAQLDSDDAARATQALHTTNAERVYRLCVDEGGGFIKIGQLLSCRPDLLPEPYITRLSALQDAAPPLETAQVVAVLEESLGAPLDTVFARFDDEPLAAASLAQVHRAQLMDGTEVALKVRRPGISERLESDIATLQLVAAALGDKLPGIPVMTIVKEVSATLRREVDFLAEATATLGFRTRFADDDRIAVPEVYTSLCSDDVLVLGFIEGERPTAFLDACADGGEAGAAARDALLGLLVDSFCRQILEHGVFHADPHPGNFLVVPAKDGGEPTLALLDFGCVEALEPGVREAYAAILGAFLRGSRDELALRLMDLGFVTSDDDPDALGQFAASILTTLREQAEHLSKLTAQEQLAMVMDMARRNPVVDVPGHFVMLGRVLGSLGGLLMHYQPQTDFFAIVTRHLARALRAAA